MTEAVMVSSTWVDEQRDREEWGYFADEGEAQAAWRRYGFSFEAAANWFDQLAGLETERLTAEEYAQIAAAWVVAGFEVQDVADWFDPLADADPFERAMLAREWRESGFTASAAAKWAAREDVTVAVLLENGGWHPRQRDLLALLLPGDDQDRRVTLLSTPLPPAHVLDYVKAGLAEGQFAAYEHLRRQGRQIDADLRDLGKQREYPDSLAFRIDAVSADLPSGSTGYHVEPLLAGAVDVTSCEHEPEPPLPIDYQGPPIIDSWSDRGLDVWTRGVGEWMEGGVPEDYAYEPILGWSESDLEVVRTAFATELDEGQSCEVSWPPEAGLWTEGLVLEPSLEGCNDHENFEPACHGCPVPSLLPDADPAEWRWFVDVTAFEHSEDGREQLEVNSSREHILTTRLDPRAVEYSNSGPLR